MIENHSIELSTQELDEIRGAISTLNRILLPKLQELNFGSKKNGFGLGDKSISFATKSCEYASEHSELVPSYINAESMKKDLETIETLRSIQQFFQGGLSIVSGSLILVGTNVMKSALIFYRSVKTAAKENVSTAGAIYEDLSKRFKMTKRKNTSVG